MCPHYQQLTTLVYNWFYLSNRIWPSYAECLFSNRSQATSKCWTHRKRVAHEPQAFNYILINNSFLTSFETFTSWIFVIISIDSIKKVSQNNDFTSASGIRRSLVWRCRTTTTWNFLFLRYGRSSPQNSTLKTYFPRIWKIKRDGNRAMKYFAF